MTTFSATLSTLEIFNLFFRFQISLHVRFARLNTNSILTMIVLAAKQHIHQTDKKTDKKFQTGEKLKALKVTNDVN